jgi:serine/threonine protein kinase
MSLKGMHDTGYLHSDVKPNNIVFELFSDINDLYLVDSKGNLKTNDKAKAYLLDFGLSERYLTPEGQHIKYDKINR